MALEWVEKLKEYEILRYDAPCTFEANGIHYEMATTGFTLAMAALPEKPDLPQFKFESVKRFATSRRSLIGWISESALRDLAGREPYVAFKKCEKCSGSGNYDRECKHCNDFHECICKYCGGDGKQEVDLEIDYYRIHLSIMNVALLRPFLQAFPEEERKIKISSLDDDILESPSIEFSFGDFAIIQAAVHSKAVKAQLYEIKPFPVVSE